MSALSELQEIAERAIRHAEGDAQATVTRDGDVLRVELTCVIDGRAAAARADGITDDHLRRAARKAALHARRPRAWPSAGLPDPAGGQPQVKPAPTGDGVQIAIASTRGVRAAWERARPRAVPPVELRPQSATPVPWPGGEPTLVLGPHAVAMLLDHLRPAFGVELDLGSGPLHGRLSTNVASDLVTLTTPAIGFDAEGLPRLAVTLIDHGAATARVHDTASAVRNDTQSTGHATRAAALAPAPEDLVLAPGDAESIEELCAPVARGVFIGALSREREADGDAYRHGAHGAVVIENGIPVAALTGAVMIDPLGVLASVEALTRATLAVPLSHGGVAVLPALRAAAGCRAV